MKLTFHHRPKPRNVDMQTSVRRNETKPPTYLFRYYQFQRARDNNITIAPHNFKARPPTLISFFNLGCVSSASLSACHRASLRSVRGLLGVPTQSRNLFFAKNTTFYQFILNILIYILFLFVYIPIYNPIHSNIFTFILSFGDSFVYNKLLGNQIE